MSVLWWTSCRIRSKNYTLEANQQGVLCAAAIPVTMAFPIFVEVDGGVKSSEPENVLVTNKFRTVNSATVLRLRKQASEKMFRPFWNTWGMQLGLFHGFISMAITPTLGQNPQLVLYGQKVKHGNQIDPCPHRHSRFTISLILSCCHI